MSRINIKLVLCMLALLLASGTGLAQTPLGTAVTYQGELEQGGQLVEDTCDFEFALFDDPAAGVQIGATLPGTIEIVGGRFTILLDFGASIFTGEARFLEIAVCCPSRCEDFTTLAPRQELTPAPHALALPGLYTGQNATSPNLIGGYSGNSVESGTAGATIGGGGQLSFENRVFDDGGTVGGGILNQAGSDDANPLTARYATVGGGVNNTASGNVATVGGGGSHEASGDFATVGGGDTNTASGDLSTVGGGAGNTASDLFATVSGGRENVASGEFSTVGGGGGGGNSANTASGDLSTVGGGAGNTASGAQSTVGGGQSNTTSTIYATVGGGWANTVSGQHATVPGGRFNSAGGDDSFAAGRRAKANHDGTFVWGDSTDADVASTAVDQFLIRAAGGVGIGETNPSAALDVVGTTELNGDVTINSNLTVADGSEGAGKVLTSDSTGGASWQTLLGGGFTNMQVFSTPGSTNFTVPAGVTKILVEGRGGGGGGGKGNAGGGAVGQGGSGGGYGMGIFAVTPDSVHTVIVGAGGAGSNGGTCTVGAPGGTSSFGTLLSATGGGGGGGCGSSSTPGSSTAPLNMTGEKGRQYFNSSATPENPGERCGDGSTIGRGGNGNEFFGRDGNAGNVVVFW